MDRVSTPSARRPPDGAPPFGRSDFVDVVQPALREREALLPSAAADADDAERGGVLPQPRPERFASSVCERQFSLGVAWRRAWNWLETPETFSDGQVWPYRVEFLSLDPDTPPGFHEGGLNIHHGPLLCLPGVIREIREARHGAYRSLDYLYGSYVGSLRCVRPTRLEFWVDGDDARAPTTRVRLRLSCLVHRRLERLWSRGQHVFWGRFEHWMARSLDADLLD